MRKRNFTRLVGVMVSEETYNSLVRVTDKKEISNSEFIRMVLEEKLDQIGKGKENG